MAMQFVRAAAPVAPWQGGKRFLSKTLIDRIVRIPHKTYVEPFVGMGGVFLRRPCRPRLEVANDRNGDIVNLFRVIQRHLPQLMDVMRFQLAGRREFERLSATDPTTLTDLECAARLLSMRPGSPTPLRAANPKLRPTNLSSQTIPRHLDYFESGKTFQIKETYNVSHGG